MMATLAFTPATISATILKPNRPAGSGRTPGSPWNETRTITVTLSGTPAFGGTAALALQSGGGSWLSFPATASDGVPFNITLDVTSERRRPASLAATIRASKSGYTDQDIVIDLAVKPTGGLIRA